MKTRLGERGRRSAVVAVLVAAMGAAGPAYGAEKAVTFGDTAGDANPASWQCVVECGGVLAPASEPAIDILSATVADAGGSFVFTIRVPDIAHVPVASTPDDIVGYDFGFWPEGAGIGIVAQRTASHQRPRAYVITSAPNSAATAQRPVSVLFDHASDIVRVTVPRAALDGAVAEVCPSCAPIRSLDDLGSPSVITYVLSGAINPVGHAGAGLGLWQYDDYDGAGPVYADRAFPGRSGFELPGLSNHELYMGDGPTTGTVAWSAPGPVISTGFPCPTLTASVELAATVVFTNGTSRYAGPVVLRGTGESDHCNTTKSGTFHLNDGTLSGRDVNGVAMDCHGLRGLAIGQGRWTLTAGGSCTLDGTLLNLSLHIEGTYLPTGVDAGAGAVDSGTVAGSMFLSAVT